MNKRLYMACAGALSLAALGCSDSNVSGSSEDPNVLLAYNSSSSSVVESSSSSVVESSSGRYELNGNLWNPSAGDFTINVARYAASLPAGAKTDGHWVMATDAENGGSSSIVWPMDYVSSKDERAIVEACNGICGTVVLKESSTGAEENPFAYVGFTLAKDSSGNPVPVDVSDWGGICVTLTSDRSFSLQLAVRDSLALLDETPWPIFAYPAVTLPRTKDGEPKTICRKWSDFQIPSWMQDEPEYWKTDVGAKAAKQLVAFRIEFAGQPGEYKFNIMSLGTYSEPLSSSSSGTDPFGNVYAGDDYPRDLWDGQARETNVKTTLYADSSWSHLRNGQWFEYTDRNEGGSSIFDWYWSDQYDGHVAPFDVIVDACGSLCCFNVILDQGELSRKPYALFGFQLAQNDSNQGVPVDISNWGGICVTYKSDHPIRMDLDPVSLEMSTDTLTSGSAIEDADLDIYKWPSVVLPKTSSLEIVKCYKWNEFTQPYLDKLPNPEKYRISGEDVAKRAVAVRFIIEGENGNVGAFDIKALGSNRN